MLHSDSSIDLQIAPGNRPRQSQPVEPSNQPLDAVRSTITSAEKMIGEHPVAALGLAIVAGVAIGWMVKRW
ncbi:MAG: hypothetical protein NXI22_06920 [bacterium]|nr:hypothetical protein [bacterium]